MGTKKININLKGLSIREINFRELTTENKKEKIEKEEKDSPLLSSNNMEVKEDSSSTSTNPVQEREKTPEQGKRFSITGLFERIQEQDDYGYDSEDSFIDDSEISELILPLQTKAKGFFVNKGDVDEEISGEETYKLNGKNHDSKKRKFSDSEKSSKKKSSSDSKRKSQRKKTSSEESGSSSEKESRESKKRKIESTEREKKRTSETEKKSSSNEKKLEKEKKLSNGMKEKEEEFKKSENKEKEKKSSLDKKEEKVSEESNEKKVNSMNTFGELESSSPSKEKDDKKQELPKSIKKKIKQMKKKWEKEVPENAKRKYFPRAFDPLLVEIFTEAKNAQGKLSGELIEKMNFTGLKPRSLKSHYTRIISGRDKDKKATKIILLQESVKKLKRRIKNATTTEMDSEIKDLVYTCVSSRRSTIRETSEESKKLVNIEEETNSLLAQLASFWPNDLMTPETLRSVWKEIKQSKHRSSHSKAIEPHPSENLNSSHESITKLKEDENDKISDNNSE